MGRRLQGLDQALAVERRRRVGSRTYFEEGPTRLAGGWDEQRWRVSKEESRMTSEPVTLAGCWSH